ncbi:MAG: hypothetical protein QOH74_824 [Gaiellales bacterium]|jgi:hypothetical protein|nr:hypothetical protein [Gaiellales bacterium]
MQLIVGEAPDDESSKRRHLSMSPSMGTPLAGVFAKGTTL